jgi:hypothetical protein
MSDGKDLLRRLRNLLNEDSDSGWLDEQTSYDYLYDAAIDFVDRTGCVHDAQGITLIPDEEMYDLNPNFLRLFLKNSSNNYYINLYDGSRWHDIMWKDAEDILYDYNASARAAIPSYFSIVDSEPPGQITGTATAAGGDAGGQQILTDAAADFTDVEAGAVVHNTTDGSDGIVLSKTSETELVTALFSGTDNDYTIGDAYVIQPQARYALGLSPIPSTAYTLAVTYVKRPAPVYSDYGVYEFINPNVLVKYAYWLYKYRDRDPNFGDAMYKFWEMEVQKKAYSINQGQRPNRFKVNMKARQ